MKNKSLIAVCIFLAIVSNLKAQSKKATFSKEERSIVAGIDNKSKEYGEIAQKIWEFAELGYMEHESSALLQNKLKAAGFKVEAGVAGMPTGFVAYYGEGKPVIGILAEFDALPGISQTADPFKQIREDSKAGHACGHHLYGTGSSAGAIAVKEWLEKTGTSGTIRLYGTPAEEGGSGKAYMVRAGLFDDTDVVLNWHAGSINNASAGSCLAIKSANFRFYGIASHAAGAPHRGRSALDGVEAMNNMANMMREHVPQESRIHYVITRGGEAPNVVPAFAEVNYYVRHPQMKNVKEIFERLVLIAKGAAMGTGTTMDYEVSGGAYNLLPNATLARMMHFNLEKVGGVVYTDQEKEFAIKIMETYPSEGLSPEDAAKVGTFIVSEQAGPFSTDTGDVSWVVPTTGLRTATWVPGTSSHSWQAVAAGGTDIGRKGMIVAAKTLALTAIEIYKNPVIVAKAKEEWLERRGKDFKYEALIGDREVPLDYRKGVE